MAEHFISFVLVTFICLFINSQVNSASRNRRSTTDDNELETVVNVEGYGEIEGSIMNTTQGKEFLAFRGIQYGEAPVGKLRFKPPEPFVPGNDTAQPFDATKEGPECIQTSLFSDAVVGQEDCLHLNVYTPQISDNLKRPVLVYIHGGAFSYGSGSSVLHGPRRILNHDVVLVTLNYRLHLFGFLSTGDSSAPGNYGLLDQLEALKWVNKHIHAFGGDPDKVTIVGESAGSASVLYQVLSPLATGLFRGAIAMSGSPISPWGYDKDPWNRAKVVGRKFGCPEWDSESLVSCLRHVSAESLMTSVIAFKGSKVVPFGPCVDGHLITDTPTNLFKEGHIANKVPMMIGVTKEEGSLFYVLTIGPYSANPSDQVILSLIHQTLNVEVKNIPSTVLEAVKKHYLDQVDLDDEVAVRTKLIAMLSDSGFISPHFETILALTNFDIQPYVYSYDYKQLTAKQYGLFGIPAEFGVGHAEDIHFLFDNEIYFPAYAHVDSPDTNEFLQLWINFVTFGDPTPSDDGVKWLPAQNESIPNYHLAKPCTVDDYIPEDDKDRKFWMQDVPELFNEAL